MSRRYETPMPFEPKPIKMRQVPRSRWVYYDETAKHPTEPPEKLPPSLAAKIKTWLLPKSRRAGKTHGMFWDNCSWVDPAKGHALDRLAEIYGVKRRRRWWLFKEWDSTLRGRLLELVRGGPNRRTRRAWPVGQPWEEAPAGGWDVQLWEVALGLLMVGGVILCAIWEQLPF